MCGFIVLTRNHIFSLFFLLFLSSFAIHCHCRRVCIVMSMVCVKWLRMEDVVKLILKYGCLGQGEARQVHRLDGVVLSFLKKEVQEFVRSQTVCLCVASVVTALLPQLHSATSQHVVLRLLSSEVANEHDIGSQYLLLQGVLAKHHCIMRV